MIKRAADFVVSFIALVILSPVFLLVVVVLLIANKGKVFFVQERVGYRERLFYAYKFRTMTDARNTLGELLSDGERLTRVGRFIRKTSLDELPQLINVLKGDMSFVGPRPLLPEYLPFYNEEQRRRHTVMPGITGLAQINGRNLTTWEKRFELDIQYANTLSFGLDLKILLLTLIKVLKSEGISPEGQVTMPKFSDYIKAKSR